MADGNLTPKQQRFVDEYLIDLNATRAAIAAGYSEKTAAVIGCENLTKPNIAAEIEARRIKLAEKAGVTVESITAELAKLGFSNMLDYVRTRPDGLAEVDLSAMTRDQAAALTEVKVERRKVNGSGDDDSLYIDEKVTIKIADKRAALVDLGKHLGMFKDKVELTGKDGAPLEVEDVTTREIARRMAFALLSGASPEAA